MSDLKPTPTTAKAFADAARFPGEDDAAAMHRRITMHEYLMTGGVLISSSDPAEKVKYSEPITVAHLGQGQFESCPWHGVDCTAWEAIRAGDGVWTKLEAELDALRDQDELSEEDASRMSIVEDELSWRPIQVRSERPAQKERVVRDSALEKKIAKQRGKSSRTGNGSGVTAKPVSGNKGPEDARDTAFKNLRGESADAITFDDDEEDDDE